MRSFREFMMRVSIKDKAEDKMWNRGRGRCFLCIFPIHFVHLNYILRIAKQSQEVAIIIDDVVIL